MINKSNYQTVILEKAIENLTEAQKGKRTQLDEFDVRHELDKLRAETDVITGWKVNADDPSKNDPQFKKAADIWQYSESAIQTVLAKVKENYSKDLTRFAFPVKQGGKKELKEIVENLKQTAFMIKSSSVNNFVLSILETAEYVQTMNPKQSKQKINILFSPVKGGGKSHFLEHLKDDAEKAGVMTRWGALPSRGDTNDDFHPFMESSLVIAQDAQEKEYYEPGIMAIGRKENIQIKEKYGKPYTARMLADVWTSTNNFLRSDRTKNIIECNSFDIKEMTEKFPENFLRKSDSVSLCNVWSYQFSQVSQFSQMKLFLEERMNEKKFATENEKMRKLREIPESSLLLTLLEELKGMPIDLSSVSVAKLVKFSDYPKSEWSKRKSQLSRIIKNLYTRGIVKHVMDGSVDYEKWDLSSLEGVTAEEVFTGEADNSDIMGEFEKTQKAYQLILDWIDSNIPDDDNTTTKEEETNCKEEEHMTVEEAVKESNTNTFDLEKSNPEHKVTVHFMRKRGKAPNFTHYMQLYVNNKITGECLLNKKYFIFNEDGDVANETQSILMADDLKQIWYSKGRFEDIENITDAEYLKFSERMLKVISGKEELHVTANVVVKGNEIFAFKDC